MSTKYIILTKDERDTIDDNTNNQIFFLNKPLVYLMPSVNQTYYAERGLFENNLIEWCKQFCNADSLFLDIGAHTGSYAISLAPYAKRVLAFEPQKMTFYALCGGVALSAATNIDCMKIGLGNRDQVGAKTLHIVSNDGGGSTVHAPPSDNRSHRVSENFIRIQQPNQHCLVRLLERNLGLPDHQSSRIFQHVFS